VYNSACPLRYLLSANRYSLLVSSGGLAQLGERVVRNDEVGGSIPLPSTKIILAQNEPNQPSIIHG
jgi:hypothetical protein